MKYTEAKAAYRSAWKDWYYWPLGDKEGQALAKKRLDKAGADLNKAAIESKEAPDA